ncbi:MAG: HAMP domain-containing sensor histidine kinase, partial [Polyangiaceae bacterium]
MSNEARAESPSSSSMLVGEKASGTTRISSTPREPDVAEGADYNLRILWPLARYVEDKHSPAVLAKIALAHKIDVTTLDGRTQWASTAAFEGFLHDVRELVGSEREFLEAAAYRIQEAYGPVRFLLWAMSPSAVYEQAVKGYRLMSNVGNLKMVSVSRTSFHLRVTWDHPISRENCLVRQAQSAALPALWGLPPAHVHEDACLAFGDPTCEIHYTWYANNRFFPILLGGLVGLVVGVGIALVEHSMFVAVSSAVIGLLVGHMLEARGANKANEGTREHVMRALTELAHEESDARAEILALGQRQRDWAHLVEQSYTSRLEGLEGVMKKTDSMQQARESTLLGFSHDLRNPLMVLASTVEFLRDNSEALGDEGPAVIEDVEASIAQMKRMLGDFVGAATSQKNIVRLAPQKLDVATLTASLTRRLRALVQGRAIVPSVMQTREAPKTIYFDPLVFDRVVDNLLTNASKYTERGSIVVEVGGKPGFIVIQVSDSGRGISEDELERIFQPGG